VFSMWSVPTSDKISSGSSTLEALNRGRESTVRGRCQGTADEDTAGWKDLEGAVVICELWRLAIAL
jgi:hypothetical protein